MSITDKGGIAFNPLRRQMPVCPECKRSARIIGGQCAWCGTRTYVPIAYFRWLWLLVVTTLAVAGIPTFSREHAGTWLLVLLLLALPLRLVWGILIPPWIERGTRKSALPFVGWYFSFCATLIVYWSLLRWLHIVLGSSRSEFSEISVLFSLPLYWINPAFLIRPHQWQSDMWGIICGNSFFYALVTFGLYKAVHARLNRSRAIRLDLTDSDPRNEQ